MESGKRSPTNPLAPSSPGSSRDDSLAGIVRAFDWQLHYFALMLHLVEGGRACCRGALRIGASGERESRRRIYIRPLRADVNCSRLISHPPKSSDTQPRDNSLCCVAYSKHTIFLPFFGLLSFLLLLFLHCSVAYSMTPRVDSVI